MGSVRNANFELFRIVTMLAIVMYHAALYSGLAGGAYEHPWCLRSAWILWVGAWGKTGINCFVLLSGYFMCEKRLTVGRIGKLVGLTEFYALSVYLLLVLCGREVFSVEGLCAAGRVFISGVGGSFVPSFIVLMLFVPFLNFLVTKMDRRLHFVVVCISVFVLCVLPSFGVGINCGEMPWFVTLYLTGAFLRKYPLAWFDDHKIMAVVVLAAFVLAAATMIVGAWLTPRMPGRMMIYYWVFPDNKIMSFLCAVSALLYFRVLPVHRWPAWTCRWINMAAASTFGVYLMHDGVLGGGGENGFGRRFCRGMLES